MSNHAPRPDQTAALQAAHAPSSTPSTHAPSLPPAAIALAGRLFEAARTGDPQSEALLRAALERGLSPNMSNDKGDTLVMLSAYHGHAGIVRILLEHGADPNRVNDRGQTPLAGSVFKNERECVAALLDGGADPEVGLPTALECSRVFKQEEYEAMFVAQVERLKGVGGRATNGHANGVEDRVGGSGSGRGMEETSRFGDGSRGS